MVLALPLSLLISAPGHTTSIPDLFGAQPAFVKAYVAPVFPDFTSNYQATVVEPAQKAAEAQAVQVATPTPAPATQAPVAPQVASTDPMMEIFMRESGNNPGSINASSGACGLGQALPCSKMPCSLSDYNCQVTFFTEYALGRYGGWPQAWAFWQQNRYW